MKFLVKGLNKITDNLAYPIRILLVNIYLNVSKSGAFRCWVRCS